MKNILLLGATGSIGKSVLSVIGQNKEKFNLYGISFNKDITRAQKIIHEFSPRYVYVDDASCFRNQTSQKGCTYINGNSDLLPKAKAMPIGKQKIKQKKDIINVRDNPPQAPVSTQFSPSNLPSSINSS